MEFTIKGVTCWLDEDEDGDLLTHKWYIHAAGYVVRNERKNGKRKTVYMHIVILERKLGRKLVKGELGYHRGARGKTDNRRFNLIVASRNEISANVPARARNKAGAKGVYQRRDGEWIAQITVRRIPRYIGTFKTLAEARAAYLEKAKQHFGEFARGE